MRPALMYAVLPRPSPVVCNSVGKCAALSIRFSMLACSSFTVGQSLGEQASRNSSNLMPAMGAAAVTEPHCSTIDLLWCARLAQGIRHF